MTLDRINKAVWFHEETNPHRNGTTRYYEVLARHTDTLRGYIGWDASSRRYHLVVLFPSPWSTDALDDVKHFLAQCNKEHVPKRLPKKKTNHYGGIV